MFCFGLLNLLFYNAFDKKKKKNKNIKTLREGVLLDR